MLGEGWKDGAGGAGGSQAPPGVWKSQETDSPWSLQDQPRRPCFQPSKTHIRLPTHGTVDNKRVLFHVAICYSSRSRKLNAESVGSWQWSSRRC